MIHFTEKEIIIGCLSFTFGLFLGLGVKAAFNLILALLKRLIFGK